MTLSHTFLQIFITSFKRTCKVSFYKNCIILKILKQIASEISQNGSMLHIKINNNFYTYVLDIIDTKIYKYEQIRTKQRIHICIFKFDNKALEAIRLPEIFNHPEIIKTLAYNYKRNIAYPSSHMN